MLAALLCLPEWQTSARQRRSGGGAFDWRQETKLLAVARQTWKITHFALLSSHCGLQRTELKNDDIPLTKTMSFGFRKISLLI